MIARPKFEYIRNQKLLAACRQIPCQSCGIADGSVVASHSNASKHGKGRSVKSSDVYVASLCHRCHFEIDQGCSMSRTQREIAWARAHAKTLRELRARDLWPAGVPFPTIHPKETACENQG
jgi:hypothetical protein